MAKIVKGEQRGRPGKYLVDYRDAAGKRRWMTCETRREAEAALSTILRETRQATRPVVDPDITLAVYAEHWLVQRAAATKRRTAQSYAEQLQRHILPVFGSVKLRRLSRGAVKQLLVQKLQDDLARDSVRLIHATLRALLYAAIDDGVITSNPAARLGQALRLVMPPAIRQERIKAMDRGQLAAFLEGVRSHRAAYVRRHYPFFLLLARTGLRCGEALALQWDDLDLTGRTVRVARGFSDGRIETPKTGAGRDVDVSAQLAEILRKLRVRRAEETLRRGWGEIPVWIFVTTEATPLDPSRVRKVMAAGLKAAGLPHFSPHDLRHTFASLLLQQGESPAYVQRQLGHASIKLTVDTYGKWLPMGKKSAVDALDDAGSNESGSKVVAKTATGTAAAAEVPVVIGGPSRTRTLDPLMKSQRVAKTSISAASFL